MDVCRLADAPAFTVLKRTKGLSSDVKRHVFWGGAFIPRAVGETPYGVCFDLFGSVAHIRLTEWVVPYETSKSYQDRMRDWYWNMTMVEPVHWMKLCKEERHPLKLRLQALKAWQTAGLIHVARKRAG